MRRSQEHGFVHVWALLVVLLVGSTANLAAHRASRMRNARLETRAAAQALYAAEAGLEQGRVLVRRGEVDVRRELRVGSCDVEVLVRRKQGGHALVVSHASAWPRGRRGLPHRVRVEIRIDPKDGRILSRSELGS